jgi:tetratricopeptide (TPR) repeat protein
VRRVWDYAEKILFTTEDYITLIDLSNTEEIEIEAELEVALVALGVAFIEALQWDLASKVVRCISNPQEKAELLQQLSLALCRAQQWDLVTTVWSRIEKASTLFEENEEDIQMFASISEEGNQMLASSSSDWEYEANVVVMIELGSQLYKVQQYKEAERMWTEAEALISTEKDDWLKSEMLGKLAIAVAQCHPSWRTEAVVHAISVARVRAEVLIKLSLQLRNAQYSGSADRLWYEAKKTIGMIQDYSMKVEMLQQLGTMFSILGEEKRAEDTWSEVEVAISMISKGWMRDRVLANFVSVLAHVQQWKRATDIAYRIETSEYKAETLVELGLFLAQAKLWKRAETIWKNAEREAYSIQSYRQRIIALIKLGTALAQTRHLEQAKLICKEIIALAQENIEYKNEINAITDLIEIMIKL